MPAAYCGVVGFKPTYGVSCGAVRPRILMLTGALSRSGLVAYGSSLDCPGILAKDVSSTLIVFGRAAVAIG